MNIVAKPRILTEKQIRNDKSVKFPEITRNNAKSGGFRNEKPRQAAHFEAKLSDPNCYPTLPVEKSGQFRNEKPSQAAHFKPKLSGNNTSPKLPI